MEEDEPTEEATLEQAEAPEAAEPLEETFIESGPVPLATSTPKRARRVQVDLNASVDASITPDNTTVLHYLTALPVVPEEVSSYTPILYTFRVKVKNKESKLRNIRTRPPPYYLQFDHAIAVIWTLFNKQANKDTLGIVQLQWALTFLESIYTQAGVHPKDVQLCIDCIQDHLIDKYAEMSGEAVVYGPSKFGDFFPDHRETPFSVNYSEMINKVPEASVADPAVLNKQLVDELENVKKVVGFDSTDLTTVVSKGQVMHILNDWKREQIEKIEDGVKMLYIVEDMMKNSDSQNFDGYTDEQQFKNILKKNR